MCGELAPNPAEDASGRVKEACGVVSALGVLSPAILISGRGPPGNSWKWGDRRFSVLSVSSLLISVCKIFGGVLWTRGGVVARRLLLILLITRGPLAEWPACSRVPGTPGDGYPIA